MRRAARDLNRCGRWTLRGSPCEHLRVVWLRLVLVLLLVLPARSFVPRLAYAQAPPFDAADAAGRDFAKNIDPRAITYVKVARRRSHVHVVALGLLSVALAITLLSLALAHRLLAAAFGSVRRVAPPVAFFLVNFGLFGAYLASCYENSSGLPFVLFAAFLLPLLILFRVWSAVGSPRLMARLGRGALAAVATVALGFLVVERVNPLYLGALGL
jgi:hypothetical protein